MMDQPQVKGWNLKAPEDWLDDYCRRADADAATSVPVPGIRLLLSYPKRIADEKKAREIEQDLKYGIRVKVAPGRGIWIVEGARYKLHVKAFHDELSNKTLAMII